MLCRVQLICDSGEQLDKHWMSPTRQFQWIGVVVDQPPLRKEARARGGHLGFLLCEQHLGSGCRKRAFDSLRLKYVAHWSCLLAQDAATLPPEEVVMVGDEPLASAPSDYDPSAPAVATKDILADRMRAAVAPRAAARREHGATLEGARTQAEKSLSFALAVKEQYRDRVVQGMIGDLTNTVVALKWHTACRNSLTCVITKPPRAAEASGQALAGDGSRNDCSEARGLNGALSALMDVEETADASQASMQCEPSDGLDLADSLAAARTQLSMAYERYLFVTEHLLGMWLSYIRPITRKQHSPPPTPWQKWFPYRSRQIFFHEDARRDLQQRSADWLVAASALVQSLEGDGSGMVCSKKRSRIYRIRKAYSPKTSRGGRIELALCHCLNTKTNHHQCYDSSKWRAKRNKRA